ncbi:MAG: SatD family protein [Acholeplasma sp.]|nr:SatD family protein [Acholeplasma sp.]
MNKAFVITADIVDSKKQNNVAQLLQTKLDEVNIKYEDLLYTKLAHLKGDEFQAIIEKSNGDRILSIIRELKNQFGTDNLRIAIAYGEILTEGNRNSEFGSWGFNGEVFYKARHVIDNLKVKKNNTVQMNTMFMIFENDIENETINLLYYNIDKILSKWSKEQWQISSYLEQNMTHEQITKMMNQLNQSNMKRSSYTRKINRSEWYLVNETEKLITNIIKEKL